ncbi:MAG: Crp/Fnr family transcriptional regulator [Candidatus Zipacnadales bacterium]
MSPWAHDPARQSRPITNETAPKESSANETLLRAIPYFARLDGNALAAVANKTVRREYDRGQMIFLEGEPCAGLFAIESGHVKVFKVSPEGREQVLHVLGPGQTFNDVAVLDGGPNPASAAALEPTTLWVVDRNSMLALLCQHPSLATAVIENLAARARHLVSLVEDLSFRSVTARLARLLLEQAREGECTSGVRRRHFLTQEEMAARLGTVREMVGRSLRSLEDEGLIRIERHRIVLLDVDGLRDRAMM